MKNLLRLLAIISFVIILPISALAELPISDPSSQNENANCTQDPNSHWDNDLDRCVLDNNSDVPDSLQNDLIAPSQSDLIAPSNPCAAGSGKICDPLGNRFGTVPELIKTILEGAIKIGMPVVALAIVYCGFLFVFARGKPEELTKARNALTYTLIGAAILLGAWAIAKMISATVLAL